MKTRPILLLLLCLSTFQLEAKAQSVDSTRIFTDRTVATKVLVQSSDTILSRNVSIISGGHLILIAPQKITIDKNFEVAVGGSLELYGGTPFYIQYQYDASGNRIRRKKN